MVGPTCPAMIVRSRLLQPPFTAVDVTLRSATTSCGSCTHQCCECGWFEARQDKETKCAELVDGAHCHLVVAIETGERWSDPIWRLSAAGMHRRLWVCWIIWQICLIPRGLVQVRVHS